MIKFLILSCFFFNVEASLNDDCFSNSKNDSSSHLVNESDENQSDQKKFNEKFLNYCEKKEKWFRKFFEKHENWHGGKYFFQYVFAKCIHFFCYIFSVELKLLPDFLNPETAEEFITICQEELEKFKTANLQFEPEYIFSLYQYILKKSFADKHDEFFPSYEESANDADSLTCLLNKIDDYSYFYYDNFFLGDSCLYESKYTKNNTLKFPLLLIACLQEGALRNSNKFFYKKFFKEKLVSVWPDRHNNSFNLPNHVFDYIKSKIHEYLKKLKEENDTHTLSFLYNNFTEGMDVRIINLSSNDRSYNDLRNINNEKFSFKENEKSYETTFLYVQLEYQTAELFYHLVKLEDDKAAFLKLFIGEIEYQKLLEKIDRSKNFDNPNNNYQTE